MCDTHIFFFTVSFCFCLLIGRGRQRRVSSMHSRWHHEALGAPDGLSCCYHRYHHRSRIPGALSSGSRLQCCGHIALWVLLHCSVFFVFLDVESSSNILKKQDLSHNSHSPLPSLFPSAMSGWFLSGGCGQVRCRQTSGGSWRRQVWDHINGSTSCQLSVWRGWINTSLLKTCSYLVLGWNSMHCWYFCISLLVTPFLSFCVCCCKEHERMHEIVNWNKH